MRVRLQHYIHDFGQHALNAFDVDFWKTATELTSFGVELRVFAGFAEIELRLIARDGSQTVLAVLSQGGAGSAFSPPLFPARLSGIILPVVRRTSDDADFFLYFGTNDQPALAMPRLCFVTEKGGAAAQLPHFRQFLRAAGDGRGPAADLLISGASGDPPAPGERVLHLAAGSDQAALSRVMQETGFGALAERNFTHLCLLGSGHAVHPEILARMVELTRFLRPGFYGAAGRYLGRGWNDRGSVTAGNGIGPIGARDWPFNIAGQGARLDDMAALARIDPCPAQALPGMVCLPLSDIVACGLPDPQIGDHPLLEYLARLGALGRRAAAPLSLMVAGGSPQDAPGPVWRDALRTLAIRGEIAGPGDLDRRSKAAAATLEAQGIRGARASLTRAAGAVFTLPKRGLFARKAAAEDLAAQAGRIAAQHRQARNPFDVAGQSPADLMWRAYALMQRRMDALNAAMAGQAQWVLDDVGRRLHEAGLDDAPRLRADLDRASILPLSRLQNRHRGQRAIIVGNGPSLRSGDLDRLKSEVTFGSNKIFLAYDQTDWRPTYYSVEDHLVLTQNLEAIRQLRGSLKIFPGNMRDYGFHAPDAIFVPRIPPASWENPLSDPDFPGFSLDLVAGLHWGSTIVYSQIQMAAFMGCREIYLIGLDHSYQTPDDKQGRTYIGGQAQNHFHPDYRGAEERWHQPNLEVLQHSYQRAFEVCQAQGIGIFNASRATKLDVFPRVDFDAVFGG